MFGFLFLLIQSSSALYKDGVMESAYNAVVKLRLGVLPLTNLAKVDSAIRKCFESNYVTDVKIYTQKLKQHGSMCKLANLAFSKLFEFEVTAATLATSKRASPRECLVEILKPLHEPCAETITIYGKEIKLHPQDLKVYLYSALWNTGARFYSYRSPGRTDSTEQEVTVSVESYRDYEDIKARNEFIEKWKQRGKQFTIFAVVMGLGIAIFAAASFAVPGVGLGAAIAIGASVSPIAYAYVVHQINKQSFSCV
jgi:hypothetical protein